MRDVIRRRGDHLTDSAQQLLSFAPLLGKEFSLQQLRAVAGDIGDEQLLGVVDELIAARIAEALPSDAS